MSSLATPKQIRMMYALLNRLGLSEGEIIKRKRKIQEEYDVISTMRLQKWQIGVVLDDLQEEIKELEKTKIKLFD